MLTVSMRCGIIISICRKRRQMKIQKKKSTAMILIRIRMVLVACPTKMSQTNGKARRQCHRCFVYSENTLHERVGISPFVTMTMYLAIVDKKMPIRMHFAYGQMVRIFLLFILRDRVDCFRFTLWSYLNICILFSKMEGKYILCIQNSYPTGGIARFTFSFAFNSIAITHC